MTCILDIMSGSPITVSPDDAALEALRRMRGQHVRHLPVVRDGRLVGIVSDRDLREAMPSTATTLSIWEATSHLAQLTVERVMRTSVLTTTVKAPVRDAAFTMLHHQVGALPVLNDRHELVGIVTASDILREYLRATASEAHA